MNRVQLLNLFSWYHSVAGSCDGDPRSFEVFGDMTAGCVAPTPAQAMEWEKSARSGVVHDDDDMNFTVRVGFSKFPWHAVGGWTKVWAAYGVTRCLVYSLEGEGFFALT